MLELYIALEASVWKKQTKKKQPNTIQKILIKSDIALHCRVSISSKEILKKY